MRDGSSADPTSIDEAVAESDDGFDVPARVPPLCAQSSDVYVDRTGFDESFVPPDALEEPVP
jgi:hypothetical protein